MTLNSLTACWLISMGIMWYNILMLNRLNIHTGLFFCAQPTCWKEQILFDWNKQKEKRRSTAQHRCPSEIYRLHKRGSTALIQRQSLRDPHAPAATAVVAGEVSPLPVFTSCRQVGAWRAWIWEKSLKEERVVLLVGCVQCLHRNIHVANSVTWYPEPAAVPLLTATQRGRRITCLTVNKMLLCLRARLTICHVYAVEQTTLG